MTKLSIVMPSKRDVLMSESSIQSALTYVKLRGDADFCLHDSSGDANKAKKYKALVSSSFKYIDATGFEARENWLGAVRASNGEYVNLLSNDDYLLSVGDPVKYEINKGIVGYIPNFLIWNGIDGVTGKRNFGITGSTASDRVRELFVNTKGANVAICSAFERKLLSEVWSLAFDNHPIKNIYWDLAVTAALVSSGTVLQDKSSTYIYNSANLRETESITSTMEKLFRDSVVSDRASLFHLLLIAIDSFILIARANSPVHREEIIQAAQYSFAQYCNLFISSFKKNKSAYVAKEVAIIEKVDTNFSGFQGLLDWALSVVEIFEPKIIQEYKNFYFISIGKRWGFF